eukprot:CAMPEP_0119433940 /NCGR_PEP_ID=MMETSP1335-20130426/50416_1 /TAXON_ID=259385 /ORGANISM="Chrysoculter rhomboideus, Strain RCC1486" /LENGTH=747 /DNA_ID=CAMNT_0007459789 /DNA_START=27 /DNA_END=2271 /DNA_ORIENTATION=+
MTTSAFVAAMDAQQKRNMLTNTSGKTRGENGAPEYTIEGVGEPRVALFFKLVRGLSTDSLDEHLAHVQRAYDESGDVQILVDLFVLTFQTRATRGEGKGEKALFLELYIRLHARFPQTAERMLTLVPHFGYFKDWLLILEAAENANNERARERLVPVVRAVLDLYAAKLNEDAAELKRARADGNAHPRLSLAAKWAPREGRHFNKQARALAGRMFPDASPDAARRLYRRRVAELNRALSTPELLMSAHRYAEIEFGRVASLAMARNRKAFLNERVRGAAPHGEEEDTGNRFPDDEDRVGARRKLRAMLASAVVAKLKGAALQPHELVEKAMPNHGGRRELSTAEKDVINAQWEALRTAVREQLAKAALERDLEVLGDADGSGGAASSGSNGASSAVDLGKLVPLVDVSGDADGSGGAASSGSNGASSAVDLGKLVPLVDVSGSMAGTPMTVAIAMGILVSELASPAFAHRFLTFESKPKWVSLAHEKGLVAKVQKTASSPWGGSTNFEAACEAILDVAEKHSLKPDEIPDLIVFSDMQFDAANGHGDYGRVQSWETHLERLQRRFAQVGQRVCGEAYPAPRIIFWNLRGNTVGFPAQADAPNVQMLSGFSPALLKLVLSGADLVADEEVITMPDGSKKVVKAGPTPYETLRKALDAEAFDVVRATIAEVGEGPFASYSFDTPEGFEAVGPGDDVRRSHEHATGSIVRWQPAAPPNTHAQVHAQHGVFMGGVATSVSAAGWHAVHERQ